METEIRQYLLNNYGIEDFVYFNPTYNIQNYYEISE